MAASVHNSGKTHNLWTMKKQTHFITWLFHLEVSIVTRKPWHFAILYRKTLGCWEGTSPKIGPKNSFPLGKVTRVQCIVPSCSNWFSCGSVFKCCQVVAKLSQVFQIKSIWDPWLDSSGKYLFILNITTHNVATRCAEWVSLILLQWPECQYVVIEDRCDLKKWVVLLDGSPTYYRLGWL